MKQRRRDRPRVLLLAYAYPPDPLVGALRPANVVQAFQDAGWDVEVITARLSGERGTIRCRAAGLCVHTVRTIPHPRHLYLHLRRLLRPRKAGGNDQVQELGASGGEGVGGSSWGTNPPAWKRFLFSFLLLPDDLQGFILPAILGAIPAVRRGVDLLYTTAPPFSDHIAGTLLKKLTRVPWVMEMRDPWTDNAHRTGNEYVAAAEALERWLEATCLRSADFVVAASRGIYESVLRKIGKDQENRLILALNGIDEIVPANASRARTGPLRVVHAGSLYHDPRPFLQALGAVSQRRGLGRRDLQVEFIGRNLNRFTDPTPTEVIERLGLGDMVQFTPWLPKAEAKARVQAADLLLLLCENFPTVVPNKLFDYLGARRPILAFVDRGGEAERMLREAGPHYLASNAEPAAAEAALEAVLDADPLNAFPANDAKLHEWSTAHQLGALVARLATGLPARNRPPPL